MSRPILLVTIGGGLALSGVLPPAVQGVEYSAVLIARNGLAPYTYTISAGMLPEGLQLDPATGLLAGTAIALGSFAFTVRATDSSGRWVQRAYTVSVIADLVLLTLSGTFATATIGVPYSSDLQITNGSDGYSLHDGTGVIDGTLPSWATLNIVGDKLRLSGMPTGSVTTVSIEVAVDSGDGQTASSVQSIDVVKDYAGTVLDDAPLGYWKADESSGAVMTDSSGNGHHATYNIATGVTQGSAPLREGSAGSLSTTGVCSATVSASGIELSPSTLSKWAIEVIARSTPDTSAVWNQIFGAKGTQLGSGLRIFYRGTNNNYLVGRVGNADVYSPNPTSGSVVHVVFEQDGTARNLYENGVLVATATGGLSGSWEGALHFMGSTWYSSSYFFKGTASDFAIYTHALGPARVLAHAQAAGLAP